MKTLYLLLLTLTLTTISAAQSSTPESPLPDLQVINAKIIFGAEPGAAARTDQNGLPVNVVSPDNGPAGLYQVTVRVKNVGSKTVKAVNWGVTIIDAEEIERVRYTTKRKIKPGDGTTLTRYMRPHYHSGAQNLKAIIERIEYTDGSVWEGRYVHDPFNPGVVDVRKLPQQE